MMRRGKVVNLNRNRMIQSLIKNRVLLLLLLLFVLGVIVGTVFCQKSDVALNSAKSAFEKMIGQKSGASFWEVFFQSATDFILILLAVFLCGTSMMGVVLIPLLIAYRGFWYGALSAFLYSAYSLKGISFQAIVIIPPALIFLIAVLFASRESIGYSAGIARLTFPRSMPENLSDSFRCYCIRYLIYSGFVLVSALADAVITVTCFHFFEF